MQSAVSDHLGLLITAGRRLQAVLAAEGAGPLLPLLPLARLALAADTAVRQLEDAYQQLAAVAQAGGGKAAPAGKR
jgi:hypothetical protein